jgi:hypothetical protein
VSPRPLALLLLAACGPAPEPKATAARDGLAHAPPDLRLAKDRPPVVLVVREGDPSAAIAIAVRTPDDDGAEAATALAGVVEARLATRGIAANVTPGWEGLRASVLAANATEARTDADAITAALAAPVRDEDVAGAKKKLAALAMRPLADGALARWARCVGAPWAMPDRVAKIDDVSAAKIEAWRAAAVASDRAAFAVAGPSAIGEAVADAVARGAAWPASRAEPPRGPLGVASDVFESGALGAPTAYATIDFGTSSDAIAIAEALGDARGPFVTRLAGLETPVRVREVVGTAHARGGCVGVVLEAAGGELASAAADALAVMRVEAAARLAQGAITDGRVLARRAGDVREAAERAAWWTLADGGPRAPIDTRAATSADLGASIVVGVPARRGSSSAPAREALASAIDRANDAWRTPVVELRSRVEAGQGEMWALFASPCGTAGESDADAGLSAIVATAAADVARPGDVRVEPWIVPDGAGIVAHGPPIAGESAAAQARRIGDVVGRALAGEPIAAAGIARARTTLLDFDAHADGAALGVLASALAPGRPSSVVATGRADALARTADAAVVARALALRGGPLRLAVLANADAAQADAALRAVDRWVDRRGPRATCAANATSIVARPGTYAVEPRNGASPEALLAYPFPPGDDAANAAAAIVASALDGDSGSLATAVAGIARTSSARVVGWPRAPALVVRVVASEDKLDAAVMQTRALVDRLHKGGLPASDVERAQRAMAFAALDPRARLVATWRGDSSRAAPDVAAFADKWLGESSLVIVAKAPSRKRSAP